MKILVIYFTMSGRTKKTAEAIASALNSHEVSYLPIELTGKFIEKIKKLDKFENNDYSEIESQLSTLDASNYGLLIIGMPTYGNFPPKVYNEILRRLDDLSGKLVVIFNTSRFTGGKCLEFMKEKVEEVGGKVIEQSRFRKFFWIGTRNAIKFGNLINESIHS
ncbi:MAG: flavodoxin family protein [Candidatus Hermodarchaeota archaeon]